MQSANRVDSIQEQFKLFNGGPVAVFVWRPESDWPIECVSQNIEGILGYSSDEMCQDKFCFKNLLPPEDLHKLEAEVKEFLTQKKPFWEKYYRLRAKDNQYRWIYDYTVPEYNEDGSIKLMRGYILECTLEHEKRIHIQENEERWRFVLEATDQGVWDWDVKNNKVYFSTQWKQMLGFDDDEIGNNLNEWSSRVHPDDLEHCLVGLEYHKAGKSTYYENEHRMLCKNGSYKWIRDKGKVIKRNENGEPLRIIGTHVDITKEYQMRRSIEVQEAKFRGIFENTSSGVAVYEPTEDGCDFVFVDFNPAAEKMHGLKREDVVGKLLSKVFPRAVSFGILGALLEAYRTGRSQKLPITHYDDGNIQEWRENTLFKLSSGELVAIFDDLTQVKQSQQLAEQANKAKSEFLANMSHEVRTPINAIVGLGDLLLQSSLDEQQKDYLVKIRSSSQMLMGIINDILDYSKIESGKLELENLPFAPQDLMEQIDLLFAQLAKSKSIKLQMALDPKIPHKLKGDMLRLSQAISNLLSNAIKFTPSGGKVELAITCKHRNENLARVNFSVKDSGVGISALEQTKLFKPFSQADASTTRRYGGTGLGLAICQRLIQKMGGDLELKSELGKGSQFSFGLDFEVVPFGKNEKLLPISSPWTMPYARIVPSAVTPSFKGCKILIVEDNSINQEVAMRMLEKTEATIFLAENGVKALEKVKEERPDLILMDLQMPLMDGYEASQRLRMQGFRKPIIALSAAVMEEDRKRALDAGMDEHLAKPIESKQLYHVLAVYLKSNLVINLDKNSKGDLITTPFLPGFDTQKGLELFDGDSLFYHKMLKRFGEQIPKQCLSLVHLLRAGEWKKAAPIAHALKGASGALGGVVIMDLATRIDAAIKQDLGIDNSVIDDLESILTDAHEALSALVLPKPQSMGSKDALIVLRDHLVKNEFIEHSTLQDALAYLKKIDVNGIKLEAYINELNFDGALKELDTILVNRGIKL